MLDLGSNGEGPSLDLRRVGQSLGIGGFVVLGVDHGPLGPDVPLAGHLLGLVRMGGREVVRLGTVFFDVVELPA